MLNDNQSDTLNPPLPLTTLLSEVLVAFTIEADNSFEQQMNASAQRTFLVSLVMGLNFLRYVPEAGISIRELSSKAGFPPKTAHPSLPGMTRWGYVKVEPAPKTSGAKSGRLDDIISLTPAGQAAQAIWQALPEAIEARWRQRFGPERIVALRASLTDLLADAEPGMPLYLPVLMSQGFFAPKSTCPEADNKQLSLPTLLSRVLLRFTLDFEQASELSLPLSVNVLRVLTKKGIPLRDLPQRSGISKQAISMALTYLSKQAYVVIEADKAGKTVCLSAKGELAQQNTHASLIGLEQRWRERFGADSVQALRDSLSQLIHHARFADGLMPPEGGWRGMKPFNTQTNAVIAAPEKLPHYPMVLHRGGYPDGS